MKKNPISDHYDGHRFFDPGLNVDKSFSDFLKWSFGRVKNEWPVWVENKFKPQLPDKTEKNEAHVTFINVLPI